MHEDILFEKGKKSFLRVKWENILIKTIKKKIPDNSFNKDEVIFLENEESIRHFFFNETKEVIESKKYIIILPPLNNFLNLISFFDKIDKVIHEDSKIILNYFSGSWKYIFSIFISIIIY